MPSTTPMHEITITARPHLRTQARLQWDAVREKQVLLTPEGVLVLNATAAAILALCDGQRSVSAIVTDLSATYNHPVDQEVLTFLKRLLDKRLIEINDE